MPLCWMAGRRMRWYYGWLDFPRRILNTLVQLDLNSNDLHLDGGREISWGLSNVNPTTTDVYRRFIACWNSSRRSRLLRASHYPIGTILVYQKIVDGGVFRMEKNVWRWCHVRNHWHILRMPWHGSNINNDSTQNESTSMYAVSHAARFNQLRTDQIGWQKGTA